MRLNSCSVTGRATRGGRGGCRRATTRYPADRPAVVEDRAVVAASTIEPARRSAVGRPSRRPGWNPLGIEDRSAMARSSFGVSEPLDVLETTPRLGRARRVAPRLARVLGAARCAGTHRLGRGIHRCDVRLGKKGGPDIGKTRRGKGSKCMVVADGKGVPLGVSITSASPSEVKLAEPTLATIAVPRRGRGRPRCRMVRLIADRAYDSDPLRRALARRGIELISPHRINRIRPKTQDGRKLRRYRRRWIIERTMAWYGSFRRLIVRYERSTRLYLAFFHFASALIALRGL